MQITIDTSQELTPFDRLLIEKLLSTPGNTIVTEPAVKPASKPAPKPAPKPEPEPEEDLIGGEPTVQDAIDAATLLIGQGKQPVVKAALKKVGGDRVGNIAPDKVAEFLAALEG
jgi:hypothetical protein